MPYNVIFLVKRKKRRLCCKKRVFCVLVNALISLFIRELSLKVWKVGSGVVCGCLLERSPGYSFQCRDDWRVSDFSKNDPERLLTFLYIH